MNKVTEDQFFKELYVNALFPRRHAKDAIYDIGTIKELEKEEKNYHIEIFYRDMGTWLVNHKSENTPEDQGIREMKRSSVFSMHYIKQSDGKKYPQFEYYISDKEECQR